ncbi:MAG TPA: hypothetical protein VMT32_21820 [Bryobacteraceae bacterium]|nr:hypothetical protein [Bryobacteraceae bacterium]
MSAITRFGDLGKIFRGGRSELLNIVAQLSVLYEDLRLEVGELHIVYGNGELEEPEMQYRGIYFLRRCLQTLSEFRGGLTRLRMTSEFKQTVGSLTAVDASYIAAADKYLQQNSDRIKELRNELGGHFRLAGIEFAAKHFSNVVGKVTWNRTPGPGSPGLECPFAADLVAGAISSKMQAGTDAHTELRRALAIISEGSLHAQGAMCALVHAFLWEEFGK